MARRGRLNRMVHRRYFRLEEILQMRPYLVRLMADLRALCVRKNHLLFVSQHDQQEPASEYRQRRDRYERQEELKTLNDEEKKLRRECRRLGVKIGNVFRGEMLFPCRVSYRDAYFVWSDDEERPTEWRFKEEARLRPIPLYWFAPSNQSAPCKPSF